MLRMTVIHEIPHFCKINCYNLQKEKLDGVETPTYFAWYIPAKSDHRPLPTPSNTPSKHRSLHAYLLPGSPGHQLLQTF